MEYPALTRALAYCEAHDIELPLDLAVTMFCVGAVKTEAYYDRVLERAVRDLYNGRITADELLDTMIRLLDEQMRRAWNEGMRQNGLDPAQDMTDEWEAQLQGIIDSEFSHVEQFISDVEAARDTGAPIDPLLSRAQLWAGRYNDVVNQSILATAEPQDKFEWIYGDTQHCSTCEALNGLVASAAEWEQSGFRPQSPPNDMLECGGWRCQCRLEPTDKRRSPKVLETLLDLATSAGLGKSMKGGEGSGNFGHAGRPGEVGGSAPGGSGTGERAGSREEYIASLSEQEIGVLYSWGASGNDIRSFQRGEIDNPEIAEKVRLWNEALEKGALYDGIVYRGLGEVPGDTIMDWIDGGSIILNNDQSASSIRDVATEFSRGWGTGGHVILEIDQASGVNIFGATNVTLGDRSISESEIILRGGAEYEVTGWDFIRQDTGQPTDWNDYFIGTDYSKDNLPDGFVPHEDLPYKGTYIINLAEKNE